MEVYSWEKYGTIIYDSGFGTCWGVQPCFWFFKHRNGMIGWDGFKPLCSQLLVASVCFSWSVVSSEEIWRRRTAKMCDFPVGYPTHGICCKYVLVFEIRSNWSGWWVISYRLWYYGVRWAAAVCWYRVPTNLRRRLSQNQSSTMLRSAPTVPYSSTHVAGRWDIFWHFLFRRFVQFYRWLVLQTAQRFGAQTPPSTHGIWVKFSCLMLGQVLSYPPLAVCDRKWLICRAMLITTGIHR